MDRSTLIVIASIAIGAAIGLAVDATNGPIGIWLASGVASGLIIGILLATLKP